ncbi:MAG: hydrolase 1, exosortase A system-associated [Pseudomonadota bacterium]|nr:hydrolase 1, exosortase A system-associated [Pseudomonadota bacterium]
MSRRHLSFACEGSELVGTLDLAPGRTGLLIVTGGNELRAGPWASQAQIAEKIAAAGFPTFRFDRRGVGDSEGENAGFTGSAADIAAAVAAFRAHVPTLKRIVAFGNCDAASALMLAGGAGLDALVLANPWTFEPEPEAVPEAEEVPAPTPMPPSVLRRHYLKRLTDPRAIWRLLTGKVQLGKMASSLAEAAKTDGAPSSLAQQMADGLTGFAGPVTILLAENDRTAQAFLANWDKADPRLRKCPGASHSFVEPQARIWLQGQILAALRSLD